MVIGSHNSWSYLRPRKWWMRLIAFAARCQRVDIREQYLKYGVRCFDLRMRYEHLERVYAHGPVEYDMDCVQVANDLFWLNEKSDCYVRVIHEARTKEQYTNLGVELFRDDCKQSQAKGKFDYYKYVDKDGTRPVMTGVYHDDGFKVASDAHILVAFKDDYDVSELEGKVVGKDGAFIDGKYPNWRSVIPDFTSNKHGYRTETVKIDFNKWAEFMKVYKADKKLNTMTNGKAEAMLKS